VGPTYGTPWVAPISHYADVCGRDMTHKIERLVVNDDNAAFIQDCRYRAGRACAAWPCSTSRTG